MAKHASEECAVDISICRCPIAITSDNDNRKEHERETICMLSINSD